jgi:hypothetical protein
MCSRLVIGACGMMPSVMYRCQARYLIGPLVHTSQDTALDWGLLLQAVGAVQEGRRGPSDVLWGSAHDLAPPYPGEYLWGKGGWEGNQGMSAPGAVCMCLSCWCITDQCIACWQSTSNMVDLCSVLLCLCRYLMVRPMLRWDTWWPCMQCTGQGSATLLSAYQLPLILHELCMGVSGLERLYTRNCWNSIFWCCMQACRPQFLHVHAQPRQLWPHSCML